MKQSLLDVWAKCEELENLGAAKTGIPESAREPGARSLLVASALRTATSPGPHTENGNLASSGTAANAGSGADKHAWAAKNAGADAGAAASINPRALPHPPRTPALPPRPAGAGAAHGTSPVEAIYATKPVGASLRNDGGLTGFVDEQNQRRGRVLRSELTLRLD